MFYEFRSRAKEIHGNSLTDWDLLFYMQHHGCRMRLLGWTENLGVAIYFALLHADSTDTSPTIWLLNAYRLNEIYHGSRDFYSPEFLNTDDEESYSDVLVNDDWFWWDERVGLYPIRRVDRLTSQGGYFTIHGNNIKSIENMIHRRENIWRKVSLPVESIKDANVFMEMAGINHFTMFPDLDGLSRYLNGKYF